MEVLIEPNARKFLESLEENTRRRIVDSLKRLGQDPFSKRLDIKKLKGYSKKPDVFRLRVGDHRIQYSIVENNIFITKVFHRSAGYDF